MNKSLFLLANCFLTVFFLTSTEEVSSQEYYLNRCNQALIKANMEDIFTPPVASRVHVYANIAAYEVLTQKFPSLLPLSGQIKHLSPIPSATHKVDYSIAAEIAFIEVAKKLIYSEFILSDFWANEYLVWQKKLQDTVLINSSVSYGKQVASHFIEWINKDNYIYTRTLERYVLNDSLGAWKPTSPEYMNALEPNWPLIRSLVSEKSDYVRAIPNIAYSENKKSKYYKEAMKVYKTSQQKDSSKIKTAIYWDDNPNTAVVNGHLTYFVHKISPPGHWLSIASQTIYARKMKEDEAAELFAMVSIGMFEGFISCWNEKYTSNSVRPETYINRIIDAKWLPLIETPPFPEYTSGHSVVSATASSMLSFYIPQPYTFYDSTQMYLNLEPRKFNSFREASDQASVSRFYGGIHYMLSLDNGAKQGRDVASFIRQHIRTRKKD